MSDKNKKILYIVFYSVLFLYLGYMLVSNKDTILKNITGEGDKIRNTLIVKNYRIKHNIITKDDYGKIKEEILLENDVFGKKMLIKKTVSDKLTEYYTDGKLLYIKENDKFELYKGKVVDNIDLKLLDLDYLSALVGSAKEEQRTINSLTLYSKVDNVRILLIYDMNKDLDTITTEKDNYSIKSKVYDMDLVKDFDPLKDN